MTTQLKEPELGIVLGSAVQFGQGGRLLVKVRYEKPVRNKLPVLLICKQPKAKDFELTYFKHSNDTVEEITLPESLCKVVREQFRNSFLFGRDSFSLSIFS